MNIGGETSMELGAGFGIIHRKRDPTDDLIEEQPLAKKLSLLRLSNGNYHGYQHDYIKPKKSQSSRSQRQEGVLPQAPSSLPQSTPRMAQEERMDVDNVVYIDSLDSDSESDDPDSKLIFLPDIERKFTKIPYNLYNGSSQKEQSSSTDVVLYSVPTSLSVPEQKDSVRRAILESRARMRAKQVEEVQAEGAVEIGQFLSKFPHLSNYIGIADHMEVEDGVDAMDIE